jgi:hypothetical protein
MRINEAQFDSQEPLRIALQYLQDAVSEESWMKESMEVAEAQELLENS